MLRTRVITALLLLAGLLAAVFLLPSLGWLIFVSAICAGGAWEWGGLGGFSRTRRSVFALLMGAACVLAGLATGLAAGDGREAAGLGGFYLAGVAFWTLVVPLWLRRKWRLHGVAGAVAVGLVVLLPAALAMVYLRDVSPWLLLGAIAAVSVADIAAYFTGRAFGRRKLAPQISPGKTWEGAGGAVLGVALFGVLVAVGSDGFGGRVPLVAVLPLMVAFTALSIEGDLFESLLKRQAGLKDSGALLPGHGGILDRIDSLTSTLPVAALAALWFMN